MRPGRLLALAVVTSSSLLDQAATSPLGEAAIATAGPDASATTLLPIASGSLAVQRPESARAAAGGIRSSGLGAFGAGRAVRAALLLADGGEASGTLVAAGAPLLVLVAGGGNGRGSRAPTEGPPSQPESARSKRVEARK